jgi:hypothetical protein
MVPIGLALATASRLLFSSTNDLYDRSSEPPGRCFKQRSPDISFDAETIEVSAIVKRT